MLLFALANVAGVGKTYAMLEAAHERQADGVDVIISWPSGWRPSRPGSTFLLILSYFSLISILASNARATFFKKRREGL